MGTCLMCHRKIRDGRKFCDNCKQKRKNKADESYLDSLLNSVGINQTGKKSSASEFEKYPDENGYYDEQDALYGNTDGFDTNGMNPDGINPDELNQNIYNPDVNNENDYGLAGMDQNGMNPDDYIGENGYDQAGMDQSEMNSGNSGDGEMDDMLSDLLGEMENAGVGEEQQPENDIREEDIESIFDEAEAYAELLNNNNGNSDDGSNVLPDMYGNIDESDANVTAGISDNGVESDSNAVDTNAGASNFIDFDWNNEGEEFSEEGNGLGSGGSGDNAEGELDEILLNEGIQGENAMSGSVQDAFSDFDPLSEDVDVEEKPKKKRLSWFKRLFGNVNDEVTPEMIEADRIKKAEEAEQEKQKKAEKKKKEEEKKAAAQAEKERKKAEADAERNRKLALAIEKKNAAKEKQRKKKEQALAIAEYEVEHGKINKAGATILFVIFAVLTIVIIIGTNIYSYNLSIENAQKDFDVQKYNEAYYEVYGLKIHDEDIELYDKIMTVMYVNTQLNAYENYMKSNNRDKALDSLLKGLQRYDKYLQLAQRLGIKNDLDYVKGSILEKLRSEFNLTEKEAYTMVSIDDSVDYSEYLYGLLGDYPEELEKFKN